MSHLPLKDNYNYRYYYHYRGIMIITFLLFDNSPFPYKKSLRVTSTRYPTNW